MAGRRPLHLPRLPRVRTGRRGGRGRLREGRRRRGAEPGTAARHGAGHPPCRPAAQHRGEPPGLAVLQPAARRRARQGARTPDAGPDQGEQPGDRAPLVLPRLRGRQEVRRGGQCRRGAPLPRAVLVRRLHRVGAPRPGGPPQGRRRAGDRGLHARQPRRARPAADPGDLPARRAVPDLGRGAALHRHLRPLPPGAPQAAALPAQGGVRAVLLGAGLPTSRATATRPRCGCG